MSYKDKLLQPITFKVPKTENFNFFKKQKEQETLVHRIFRIIFTIFASMFKVVSYLLGSLMVLGIVMSIISGPRYSSHNENQISWEHQHQKMVLASTASTQKLVDLLATQKDLNTKNTIELLNKTYTKSYVQYNYATPGALEFSTSDSRQNSFDYLLTFNADKTSSLRVINANREIISNIEKIKLDKNKVNMTKKSNNEFDNILRQNEDYINFEIKN